MKNSGEPCDPRVDRFTDYVESMQRMEFEVRDFGSTEDPLGRLGRSLVELSAIMERCFEEHGRLLDITERVNRGFFIGEVMDHIYASFRPLIPYDRMGFALLEDHDRMVRAHWARSDSPQIRIQAGFAQKLTGSSLKQILEDGEARILNDLETYLDDHPHSHSTKLMLEEGIRSSLTCPLVALGKPVGFLFFSSRAKNTYENVHLRLFRRIASQLSVIVEKSRLYEELYQLNAELVDARNALQHQATHDGLTELWNRRAIRELLHAELGRAKRAQCPAVAILIDVDNFKRINDTYGHPVGDAVLCEVAKRLREVARRGEAVGRYGGEEFLVVLAVDQASEAEVVAERFRNCIDSVPIEAGGHTILVTASLGVGIAPAYDAMDSEQILKLADDALYRAKDRGRNRIEVGAS